jgi:ribose-phosphate pyrophosphokinase
MDASLICGSANPLLGEEIGRLLGIPVGWCKIERFPDGEQHVQIMDSVRGRDVYVIQPTSPPADRHLVELLLLADAARRAGAARLTAVMPYFAYARQDRRAKGREPVSARLVADLIQAAGYERVIAVHLHTGAIEGFFRIGVEHLTPVPPLAEAARRWLLPDSVVLAPDLGAVKLAERYAAVLGLPVAFAHKTRVSGEEVSVSAVTGDVRGRAPVIVDDMISTGSTIVAAAEAAVAAGSREEEILVVASHGLFVGPAVERLRSLPLRQLIVTDSVFHPEDLPFPLETVSVAPLLAKAIAQHARLVR